MNPGARFWGTPVKSIQFEQLNSHSLAEGTFDKAIVPLGSCESHGDHLPFGTDAIIAHKLTLEVGRRAPNTLVPPSDAFEVLNGSGHGGEGETAIGIAMMPELVDMSRARGTIPTTAEYVKQIWNSDALASYGATGAPSKAARETGEMMRDVPVDCLVGFLKRMDRQDWNIRTREG